MRIKKSQFKQPLNNGHTLMEIMVVIIVAGVLAAIALPNYGFVVENTKKSEAFHVLETLRSAQILYNLEHGAYTSDITDLEIESFPQLKNFDTVTVNTSDPVAKVSRVTGSGYSYDISVYVNGTFICDNESPAGTCAHLGF